MVTALVIAIGYLAGSIPTGYWLIRATKGIDVRTVGSGNIGASNVWRSFGRSYGIPVVLLDVAKGFGPALAGTLLVGDLAGVPPPITKWKKRGPAERVAPASAASISVRSAASEPAPSSGSGPATPSAVPGSGGRTSASSTPARYAAASPATSRRHSSSASRSRIGSATAYRTVASRPKRKRLSVPARSRPMLARCSSTTATAASAPKAITGHGSPRSTATTGSDAVARIEASDA